MCCCRLEASVSRRERFLSVYPQSTSQRAARFWLARLIRLLRPIPPTPTHAMFRTSLGGVNPRPSTCRGTMVKAALLAATLDRKLRRVISFSCVIERSSVLPTLWREPRLRATPKFIQIQSLIARSKNVYPYPSGGVCSVLAIETLASFESPARTTDLRGE